MLVESSHQQLQQPDLVFSCYRIGPVLANISLFMSPYSFLVKYITEKVKEKNGLY